jgi:hypothetical protein
MRQATFSLCNAVAECPGRHMYAIHELLNVVPGYHRTILDDEMKGAMINTQNQARQTWCYFAGPPTSVLRPECGWVKSIRLVMCAVQPLVNKLICASLVPGGETFTLKELYQCCLFQPLATREEQI